jgi:Ni/Co efflux regulator RcnB
MKRFFTASAATALALSLLTAPMAMAQQAQAPMGHSDQPGRQSTSHDQQRMAPAAPQRPVMQDNHMQPNNNMQHAQAPQRPQGQQGQHMAMQPSHNWRHGDRYTGGRHVVSDWNRYHASPPPRGYEWVQDGNELVLISITSGIIASVLANAIYQ